VSYNCLERNTNAAAIYGVTAMFSKERKAKIISLLEKNHRVIVNELAREMGTSQETIRRDLRDLEKDGLVKRTHGGAILDESSENRSEYPVAFRAIQHYEEKLSICKLAATLIEDGDTIFIDNSSTTVGLLRYIDPSNQITIITNSIRLLMEYAEMGPSNISIVSLGGIFRAKNYSTTGVMAHQSAESFRPQKAFLSCRGIQQESGFTDGSIYEVDTKKVMIENGRHVYMLADYSKFGMVSPVALTGFSSVEMVVTDAKTTKEDLIMLQNNHVKTMVAD